jgi:23S rRNA (pseudouridine1915-N3)-methyltransferase
MAFLIGGPDGHGAAALEGAALKLSLGSMTLPHGMARAVLIEQLYRAATILSGHPYHRA